MIINSVTVFAQSSNQESGIGAFHINLKSFLFQLITFTIVLLIFKRWILPPLTKTLEERRNTLDKSLEQAKETESALARAEAKAEELLAKARQQADEALAEAKKASVETINQAEAAAAKRAELIIQDAEKHLGQERDKLRTELKSELADLVADASGKIIKQKLDDKEDLSLIEKVIKGVAG